MRLIHLILPPAALLLLLSCSGGGGGGGNALPNSGVPAPANLHTVVGPGPKDFALVWDPPSTIIDGYNLEAQEGSGSFQKLNTGLIPASYTSLMFTFLDTAPEDTNFTFRLNAARGTQTSPFSNTTTANSGLGTPGQPTGQYDWDQAGVTIGWSRNSTASTGFRLERTQTDSYGFPTGTWTLLSAANTQETSFLDTTVSLGVYYSYRVINTKGLVSSVTGPASRGIFTGLPAPSQPVASFDFNAAGMAVSWIRNTTFNDGINLERIETNNYGIQTGTWTKLTVSDPAASTFLDTTVTANAYYSYRVTNLRNSITSTTSPASNSACAGLAPLSYLTASWDSSKSGVSLYWYGSGNYQLIHLERVACDAAGQPQGNWGTLASLSGSSSGYTDLTTQENSSYLYRASGTRGSYSSLTVSTYPLTTPLNAPVGLAVAPATGGLRLTWQNRSLAASQIVIRRTPSIGYSNDIAILSPGTTSYLDPLSSLGYFTYAVVAKNGYQEAYSQWVTAATPNPAGALSLTKTILYNYPNSTDAALCPAGSWALVSASPFGVLSNNDPWPAYFPGNFSRWARPIVQVDKQGWPHAVYAAQSTAVAGEQMLQHIWYDGSKWNTETLASAKIPWTSANAGWTYRLDSSGTPHVLLDHLTTSDTFGGSTSSLIYLHKVGTAWIQESLSVLSPAVANIGTYHITLDDADVPHVVIGNWSSIIDYVRTGAGAWTSTTIPTGTVSAGWYDYLDAFWIDGSNGWVFYESSSGASGLSYSLYAVQMKAGSWQAPVLLGGRDHDGASTTAVSALSPDRTKVAVVYKTSAGLKCYHHVPDGWHETLVAPNSVAYPWLWLAFDGAQKIHILKFDTSGDFTEFRE